jgi:hypothetical protein
MNANTPRHMSVEKISPAPTEANSSVSSQSTCCYLAECTLGDPEDSSGMRETYWLLAIQAASKGSKQTLGNTDLSASCNSSEHYREGVFKNNRCMAA